MQMPHVKIHWEASGAPATKDIEEMELFVQVTFKSDKRIFSLLLYPHLLIQLGKLPLHGQFFTRDCNAVFRNCVAIELKNCNPPTRFPGNIF